MIDSWERGEAYEAYVGRWSRLVALDFVRWLGAPAGSRWLDVGCGTGALSRIILEIGSPRAVTGIDSSSSYVRVARDRMADSRATFDIGDASALPVATGTCDAVVSGLALNFFPDPVNAVAEWVRVARPGGIVGAYVWDYAGQMELMRRFWDAAISLDPAALELDEGRRFPLCRPAPLEALFQGAGLLQVVVRSIDVPTRFRDFDDLWAPFLGGQGPAPGYAMSLDAARRGALREKLREQLPFREDGSLAMIARAWAVRGVRGNG